MNCESIYLVYTWYIPCLKFLGFPDVRLDCLDSRREFGCAPACQRGASESADSKAARSAQAGDWPGLGRCHQHAAGGPEGPPCQPGP